MRCQQYWQSIARQLRFQRRKKGIVYGVSSLAGDCRHTECEIKISCASPSLMWWASRGACQHAIGHHIMLPVFTVHSSHSTCVQMLFVCVLSANRSQTQVHPHNGIVFLSFYFMVLWVRLPTAIESAINSELLEISIARALGIWMAFFYVDNHLTKLQLHTTSLCETRVQCAEWKTKMKQRERKRRMVS